MRLREAKPARPATGSRVGGAEPYPSTTAGRDDWILARRGERPAHAVDRPHTVFAEDEPLAAGGVAKVLTVLLVSRECSWRCLECDLWRYTVRQTIPRGAIPTQVRHALDEAAARGLAGARQLKLYNGGSFFDPRAVPPTDDPAIAQLVCGFDRVIVESHPALVGARCVRLRDLLRQARETAGVPPADEPVLEVAMGLETVHQAALAKLNKRMTLGQFRRAAEFLAEHRIALRAFVLVQPPFVPPAEALEWAMRSVEFAFECHAAVAVLIPTRFGNGALEALAAAGQFAPPALATLEAAVAYGLGLRRGRVLGDLWDLGRLATCRACFPARAERLRRMNLGQAVLPPVACGCGAGAGHDGLSSAA